MMVLAKRTPKVEPKSPRTQFFRLGALYVLAQNPGALNPYSTLIKNDQHTFRGAR